MLKPHELHARLKALLELERQRLDESKRALKKMNRYIQEVRQDLESRKGDAGFEKFLSDRPEFVEVVNNIQNLHKKQLEAEQGKEESQQEAEQPQPEAKEETNED